MGTTHPPSLPVDLERLIFEVTALSWPRRLIMVAWRVKTWVEPLLYRTIIVADSRSDPRAKFRQGTDSPFAIESSVLLSLIHTKQPPFFKDSAPQLFLKLSDTNDEAVILAACSNVENLWLSTQATAILPELNVPLRRLHCSLRALFGYESIDFTHKMFASITHLELFDVPQDIGLQMDENVWMELTHLPRLTHLAFNDEQYIPTCFSLLRVWTSLRVLVVLLYRTDGRGPEMLHDAGVPELAHDPRFIIMRCPEYLEDWVMGAYRGEDYWSRAGNFITKRKSGELNPLEYYYILESDEQDDRMIRFLGSLDSD
ncbi:hypothetical protein DFH06DRAFT_1321096 [Mycena polygramma]|nr:hypothetical protein DFH06DRAFT_1321096 [Mycena polygramma]